MSVVLKLKKPIQAHGETLSQLTFKGPTGGDIAASGYPWRMSINGTEIQRVTDARSVSTLICRLAQIPTSSVDALDVLDWQEAMLIVLNFFRDSEAETES